MVSEIHENMTKKLAVDDKRHLALTETMAGTSKSPLVGNEVSWDQRTKMIDWMVEVSSAFHMTDRAYFLAAHIFD